MFLDHHLKVRSQNVGLPDKTHCTVYYTVPFLPCNQLKLIDIPVATISSNEWVSHLPSRLALDWEYGSFH